MNKRHFTTITISGVMLSCLIIVFGSNLGDGYPWDDLKTQTIARDFSDPKVNLYLGTVTVPWGKDYNYMVLNFCDIATLVILDYSADFSPNTKHDRVHCFVLNKSVSLEIFMKVVFNENKKSFPDFVSSLWTHYIEQKQKFL